jgi:hypothetical protein
VTGIGFQAAAVRQGRVFEAQVEGQLLATGWTITARNWVHPAVRVEVDRVAVAPDGQEWWIECKGSWLSASGRNGLLRTDTTRKAIASAALLATLPDPKPFMLVTSQLPAGPGVLWLDIAKAHGWITAVHVLSTFVEPR